MNVKRKDYDVVIIGAGIAGICTAYELALNNQNMRIALIEKGKVIYERKCPALEKNIACIKCDKCSIMNGFGGAGGFSDGKYNITTEFGGWLTDYISEKEALSLIRYVDKINMKFGGTSETYSTRTKEAKRIQKEALKYDLHLLQAEVKHLGTENNFNILCKMYEEIKECVDVFCETEVENICKKTSSGEEYLIELKNDTLKNAKGKVISNVMLHTKYLVAAPGRSGAEWFAKCCRENLDIELENNQVDIGVRVELPYQIFEDITSNVYEAKLKYLSKRGNMVRTFCMNPRGYVVNENTDGIITVNGHSFADKKKGSQNTNFAILVSTTFTEPFNDPYQYGKRTASFSNLLGNGIIVQRFGDLKNHRRSKASSIKKSFTTPTLSSATPGDLGYVLQYNQLTDIIEMIERLDKIAPGTANSDTLLYGVEVKFYSARPKELSNKLETKCENLFAIGDGAGITRGLAQAGASGILVAREILNRIG